MVNEEVLTALRNAITRGENIETASRILINSGYDVKDVQEASNFVSGTSLNLNQSNLNQNRYNQINRFPSQQIQKPSQLNQILQQQGLNQGQNNQQQVQSQQIQQDTTQKTEPAIEKPKSYKKEIILFIILVVLVGFLVASIFFKQEILGFLSETFK